MKLYKCDRCGNTFNAPLTNQSFYGYKNPEIYAEDANGKKIHLDLCPICKWGLYKWWVGDPDCIKDWIAVQKEKIEHLEDA